MLYVIAYTLIPYNGPGNILESLNIIFESFAVGKIIFFVYYMLYCAVRSRNMQLSLVIIHYHNNMYLPKG